VADAGVPVPYVGAERGLAVSPGRDQPVAAALPEGDGRAEPGGQLAAVTAMAIAARSGEPVAGSEPVRATISA
jgi:hypothetical protein